MPSSARRRPQTAALLLPAALVACLSRATAGLPAPVEPGGAGKLVVEDAAGAIVAWADLPAAFDAATTREETPGGVQVVRSVASGVRAALQRQLDALLAEAGLRRMLLRRALREGRLTCHAAYYLSSTGEFSGVGGLACGDALVFRAFDDGRPIEQQIGLMSAGIRSRAGMVAQVAQRALPDAGRSPGPVAATGPAPASAPATWEALLPILEALPLVERDSSGETALRICAGANHLDRLAPEARNPPVERAAVRALIRLSTGRQGVTLVSRYLEDPDFPKRVFEDAEILARLIPLLREELRRAGVAPAF